MVGAPTSGAGVTTRPAAVTALTPFEKSGPVTVTWTNPRDIDRDVVRLARGPQAPATPHDGRAVTLGRQRASHVVLRRLADGQQYSVSVWTKRDGMLSRRVTTSFTTKSFRSMPAGPGTLAGHVVDTAGDPLRNAVVLAFGDSGLNRGFTSRTDSGGDFRMTVPRGRYFVATLGNHAKGGTSDRTGYLYDFTSAPVHTGRGVLHFVLADGAAITGTVTDSAGAPLRGVQVALRDAPAYLSPSEGGVTLVAGGPAGVVRTDADGHYRFNGVVPGAFVPCFATRGAHGGQSDAAGYVSRCADRSVAAAARRFTSAGADTLASLPHASTGFGAIAGTVTGVSDTPARGVKVEAYGVNARAVGATGRSDARGHFALRKLSPGRYVVCAARASAYACNHLRVAAGLTSTIALRFKPSGSLSGVVRNVHGDRLGQVSVEAAHFTATGGFAVGTSADDRGNWTLDGLPGGLYRVCFGGGGSGRDPFGGRSGCIAPKVRVIDGRDRIGVDRTLAPGGALTGTVTDSAGKPVADAGVLVMRNSRYGGDESTVTTDSRGRYLATGLTPGTYRVCAELDYDTGGALSRCAARIAVAAKHTTQGIDLALPADAPLTATITDGSANPLSGVDVTLLSACRSGQYCTSQPVFSRTADVNVAASAVTGPDGTITFHGLRPGRYAACALAYYAASATTTVPSTGYADKCASSTYSLRVTRGGNAATGIALAPGAAVSGLVQNAAGGGLPGVSVRVARAAARDFSSYGTFGGLYPSPLNDIVTGADGRYTVRSVAPGSRSVCGVPPRGLGVRRGCLADPVDLPAGTTTEAAALTLPASAQGLQAAARVSANPAVMPLGFLRPQSPFLPSARRIPVVSSSGWPAYRLLPRH
ncbi:MAG TPA: carboxypeptidase-like regulatory domain-containing protein [Jatrophihabitans sp.]|jgi:protocatechuate 3,4-dioxygenase beta subunit